MDLLLVSSIEMIPQNAVPQIGQASIWNILRKHFQVDVINFDYLNFVGQFKYLEKMEDNISNILSYLLSYKPAIIGFYTISSTYPVVIELAKNIKELSPDIQILLGGPLATLTAYESLSAFEFLDVIALGESELYIEDLVGRLLNKQSLENMKGIAYRNSKKEIIIEPFTELISENELCNYTVYDYEYADLQRLGSVPIDVGRGCPFHCTFCSTSSYWGHNFRIKQPKQIIEEMSYYFDKYGISHFNFEHDMFTVNKAVLKDFCYLILQNTRPFTWTCSSRVDTLDRSIIDNMAEAKCKGIFVGIESGSKIMQRKVKKNLDLFQAKEILYYMNSVGINIVVSFIYGFPGEEESEFFDTIEFIQDLLLKNVRGVQLHLFMPLPKTEATSQIYEQLYLDYGDVDVSIFNPIHVTAYMKKIIETNKDIFSGFYTFETDVRREYNKIDILLLGMTDLLSSYHFLLSKMLREHKIVDIYKKFRDKILICANDMFVENIADTKMEGRRKIYELIQYIIRDFQYDSLYSDMYCFETELFNLRFSDEDTSYMKLYLTDVVALREEGRDEKVQTIVRFHKEKTRIRFSKLFVELD